MKAETSATPQANRRRQQQAFDHFLREYNEERPHEALDQRPPATVYTSSPRRFPERVPQAEYDSGVLVRCVYPHGQFFWKGKHVFLSKVLAGERIGLEPLDDRYWCVRFGAFPIAYFDSAELVAGNLPDGASEHGDGNLEISKSRDSQIPTATTATAGNDPKTKNNQTPDGKVSPIRPV